MANHVFLSVLKIRISSLASELAQRGNTSDVSVTLDGDILVPFKDKLCI